MVIVVVTDILLCYPGHNAEERLHGLAKVGSGNRTEGLSRLVCDGANEEVAGGEENVVVVGSWVLGSTALALLPERIGC